MVTPTKYRSVFTGQEIDEAVSSLRGTLKPSLFSNDFNGGTDKIASAELVKTLKTIVDSYNTGSNMRSRLLGDIASYVLTTPEYNTFKDLSVTTAFKGSYSNAAARDAALSSKYSTFNGTEITFLIDDGSGDSLGQLSRWNAGNSTWVKVDLTNPGGTVPVTIAAISTTELFNYRTNRYSAMKCLVTARNSANTQCQVQEVLITHVVADTYTSVYNELGNVSNLFNLASSINTTTGIVSLNISTLVTNVKVSAKIIAMI